MAFSWVNKEWTVDKGEVVSLFDPSESGKTLTIQSIEGLESFQMRVIDYGVVLKKALPLLSKD